MMRIANPAVSTYCYPAQPFIDTYLQEGEVEWLYAVRGRMAARNILLGPVHHAAASATAIPPPLRSIATMHGPQRQVYLRLLLVRVNK